MKALITGASAGLGKEMAKYLSQKGVDLVLVARDENRLREVKSSITTDVKVDLIALDLSDGENCIELFKNVQDIDILINNAGFGTCGEFTKTDVIFEKKYYGLCSDVINELNMVSLNICTVHMLTKLYLQKMNEKNSGFILNVSSIAGFMPGPLMATYYASKAYVFRLTQSIQEELRRMGSEVKVSCLCPGPFRTEFLDRANVKFKTRLMTKEYVAKYAIDNMFKGKKIIIPGIQNKCIRFLSKIFPDKLIARIIYNMQEEKNK